MSTTNVLRYTALGLGVLYGFSHQRKITSTQKTAAARHEYEHKQHLIEQAKAEFAKKSSPAAAAASSSVNTDFNDPKFDLEAYLNDVFQKNP
ncbi:hypothetical protein RB594_003077 [Gaeumannomyces avenae]